MAAGGWLSGIGAALSQGVGDYRKGKIYEDEKARQAELDARDAERDRVQMALMQSQDSRAQRAEERAAELQQRDLVKEALLMSAPDAAIDSGLAERAGKAGLGHLVGSRGQMDGIVGQRFGVNEGATSEADMFSAQAAPSENFRKATFQESEVLADRALKNDAKSRQDIALEALNSPRFEGLDPASKQKLWSSAGLPGQAPESKAERLYWINLEQKNAMQRAAVMYPPTRFDNPSDPNVNQRALAAQIGQTLRSAAQQLGRPLTPDEMQEFTNEAIQAWQAASKHLSPGDVVEGGTDVPKPDPLDVQARGIQRKLMGGK